MLNFVGPPALTVNIMINTVSSSIVVQWDEVDDSLTTTYIVTWTSKRDNILHHATITEQSSYTITGLTLDTVYTITVTAANICGDGSEYRTSVSLTTVTTSSINPTTTTHSMMSTTIPSSISITTAVTSSSITATTILMTNPSRTTINSFTTTVSRIATTTTNLNATITTNLNATITTTMVEDSSIATVTTTITNNLCTYVRPYQINCYASRIIYLLRVPWQARKKLK